MRIRGLLVCGLLALSLSVGPSTTAQAGSTERPSLQGRCAVSFSGSSTLHGFAGTAPCEPFTLEAVNGGDHPVTWKTRIRVAVAKISTDNSGRDRKMAKMFDAETYPWIEASFDTVEPVRVDTLEFQLSIGKSTHAVVAKISDWNAAEDELSFAAEFSLSLAEYGLKPPSVFGIIRVADEVAVRITASVKRER